MSSRITQVELWHCPLAMPRELHLGSITYRSRDYIVLRLTTEDGVTGAAVGYSRNTPVFEAVRELTPHLMELDSGDPSHVLSTLRKRFAPGWGAMVRGASLIDIALWDILARQSGRSITELFGADNREVPLMAVAGYFLDQRGPEAIVDEVRQFCDEGYETIKLIVPGHERAADLALVSAVAATLPDRVQLGIDFHGAFNDVPTAIDYCGAFEEFSLRFIEDPFASYETDSVIAVANALHTPVATGEDLITVSSYRQLLAGGAGYLRIDASATGGYTNAIEGVDLAASHGATAAPHVWPHLHIPLAARSKAVGMVEVVPSCTGADPIDQLLSEPFPIKEGRWQSPAQEGLYLPLDWEKVNAMSSRHWSIGA
ncbi:mandelate racemase/muconate lactonizing enzyme family protein [Paenarthrobacter sp. NPDC091669]|uniref:mandelate racemase/muconate lactonizing enzyme family protein n=1 Tax=Paenarthrobacter sp. NPDC091669 TaxID=3364384 RepID=UPI003811A1F8